MSNQGIPDEIELSCSRTNKFHKKLLAEAKQFDPDLILVSNQKKAFKVHSPIITKQMNIKKTQHLDVDLDDNTLNEMIQFVYGDLNIKVNPENAHKYLIAFEKLKMTKFADNIKNWYTLLMQERQQMHQQANSILLDCIKNEQTRVQNCIRIANYNERNGFVAFQANKPCQWVSVEKKHDQLKENQALFVLLDESGQVVYHNILDYHPETFSVIMQEQSSKCTSGCCN